MRRSTRLDTYELPSPTTIEPVNNNATTITDTPPDHPEGDVSWAFPTAAAKHGPVSWSVS
ncbi:hypothetical protein MAP00_007162 [Monascus purpureus]|nr:hypothetical protein MAP00_007162 [Monascus purpureus]